MNKQSACHPWIRLDACDTTSVRQKPSGLQRSRSDLREFARHHPNPKAHPDWSRGANPVLRATMQAAYAYPTDRSRDDLVRNCDLASTRWQGQPNFPGEKVGH